MYFWKDIMSEKITVMIVNTEKHSHHYGSL